MRCAPVRGNLQRAGAEYCLSPSGKWGDPELAEAAGPEQAKVDGRCRQSSRLSRKKAFSSVADRTSPMPE